MAQLTSLQDCLDRHKGYPERDYTHDPTRRFQERRLSRLSSMVAPGSSLLDVGCNAGHVAKYIPQADCHGVDLDEHLVELAKKRLKSARVGTAENLPFADNSFDVVLLAEILEHVFNPVAVLREAARVAKLKVIGSTPHPDGMWGRDRVESHRYHVRCYSESELRRDLSLIGQVGKLETVAFEDGGVSQGWVFEVVDLKFAQ